MPKLKWLSRAFGANKIFCYSFLMNTASLFADPNLLQLERVFSEPEQITLIVKTAPYFLLYVPINCPSARMCPSIARSKSFFVAFALS